MQAPLGVHHVYPERLSLPEDCWTRFKCASRKVNTQLHDLLNRVKEYALFFKLFVMSPSRIGSVLPSSNRLASVIVDSLNPGCDPKGKWYLEIGPGTGPFTKLIVARLRPEDHLDLVEYSGEFCSQLRLQFGSHPRVRIFQQSILEFKSNERYDHIISGLPLTAFHVETVRAVYGKFRELLKENESRLSYFEYPGLVALFRPFRNDQKRRQVDEVVRIKQQFLSTHPHTSTLVCWNVPPARVIHVQFRA